MSLTCIKCKKETSSTTNDMCYDCYHGEELSKKKAHESSPSYTDRSESMRKRRRQEEESAANDAATIAMLATVIAAGGM